MRTIANIVLSAFGLMALACPTFAQGANGRGDCKPQVSIGYYKIAAGKQDEWLALYKKWHYPIMKYSVENGAVLSEHIYASGTHMGQPLWDFAIIITKPAPGEGKKLSYSRPDLIRHLFPDLKAYVAGEKERWSLTEGHWDEQLNELDPNEEPFSVYWPVDGGCKKVEK
jgi:hypothetical protein